MTDDIVTRLRKKYLGQLPICLEAADEIERLRFKLEQYRGVAIDAVNRVVVMTAEKEAEILIQELKELGEQNG